MIGDKPLRSVILREAERLTCGDRNTAYGPPVDNMAQTAMIFTALTGKRMSATEAAVFMVALKLARLPTSPQKMDHYVDAAAYLGIVAECVEAETGPVE